MDAIIKVSCHSVIKSFDCASTNGSGSAMWKKQKLWSFCKLASCCVLEHCASCCIYTHVMAWNLKSECIRGEKFIVLQSHIPCSILHTKFCLHHKCNFRASWFTQILIGFCSTSHRVSNCKNLGCRYMRLAISCICILHIPLKRSTEKQKDEEDWEKQSL